MILVAGPAANFIFSFVLLIFINIFYGISIDKPEISYVEKDMPAYNSGLKEGDLIIEIDGNKIEKFSEIKRFIENKNNQSINLLFSRDGKVSEVKVNVINNIIPEKTGGAHRYREEQFNLVKQQDYIQRLLNSQFYSTMQI